MIGVRGRPLKRKLKNISQIIDTVRERHSKKPDIVRKRICDLYGNLTRIELFAREMVDGARPRLSKRGSVATIST